ncbi:MAG: shikimate dehydrogenase [Mariprofundales bacterium]
MQLSAASRVYGIIGHPVNHSLSPLFQNNFLQQRAIDACYVPLPVAPEALQTALNGLWACGIQGINITVPHKEQALVLVEADDAANTIGAVNTLRRGSQQWQACNTDWLGMRQVLESLLHSQNLQSQRPQSALILGAGGTARAALHACNSLGMTHVAICNRTEARADTLAEHAKHQGYTMDVVVTPWQQAAFTQACSQSSALINTTTIGLSNNDVFPFAITAGQNCPPGIAIDAVYRPNGMTPFVEAARRCGRESVDGLPMLIAQGAASFYYWHELDVNRQQALDAVCKQLSRAPMPMYCWEETP